MRRHGPVNESARRGGKCLKQDELARAGGPATLVRRLIAEEFVATEPFRECATQRGVDNELSRRAAGVSWIVAALKRVVGAVLLEREVKGDRTPVDSE